MEGRLSGKQIILLTVIVANVLLFALIWAKHAITIPSPANIVTTVTDDVTTTEYEYELENVSITDGWRIEHYRQFALTVNNAGDVLSKEPTEQTQHLKYWIGR